MKINTGSPIILVDSSGIELEDGTKGWAKNVAYVDKWYVWFMPVDSKEMYVITADRLELDEEAVAAGLTLNQDT